MAQQPRVPSQGVTVINDPCSAAHLYRSAATQRFLYLLSTAFSGCKTTFVFAPDKQKLCVWKHLSPAPAEQMLYAVFQGRTVFHRFSLSQILWVYWRGFHKRCSLMYIFLMMLVVSTVSRLQDALGCTYENKHRAERVSFIPLQTMGCFHTSTRLPKELIQLMTLPNPLGPHSA